MNLPGVHQFFCQKLPVSEHKEMQHQHMTASTWEPDKKDNTCITLQTSVTDSANVGGSMSSFSDADSYKFQTAGTLFF